MSAPTVEIGVSAVFHTAHRLPALPGKCQNLHGHSWEAWFSLAGPVDGNGIVVDFGLAKELLRGFVLARLDHGTMLGAEDKLCEPLADAGCKLYRFGADTYSAGLDHPTVENCAVMLYRAASGMLPDDIAVTAVEVRETESNRARYSGP